MIDQKFCEFLEYEISNALAVSDNGLVKDFWCDGFVLYEDKFSAKFINDKRKLTGTAFVGKTGQDEYELIITFGRKSLSKLARGLEIKECIPDSENSDWVTIDIDSKRLTIHLK